VKSSCLHHKSRGPEKRVVVMVVVVVVVAVGGGVNPRPPQKRGINPQNLVEVGVAPEVAVVVVVVVGERTHYNHNAGKHVPRMRIHLLSADQRWAFGHSPVCSFSPIFSVFKAYPDKMQGCIMMTQDV